MQKVSSREPFKARPCVTLVRPNRRCSLKGRQVRSRCWSEGHPVERAGGDTGRSALKRLLSQGHPWVFRRYVTRKPPCWLNAPTFALLSKVALRSPRRSLRLADRELLGKPGRGSTGAGARVNLTAHLAARPSRGDTVVILLKTGLPGRQLCTLMRKQIEPRMPPPSTPSAKVIAPTR